MLPNSLIRADAIPAEGLHLDVAWDVQPLAELLDAPPGDFRVCSPLKLVCDCSAFGKKVDVHGFLQVDVELACSRCLEQFVWPLEARFRYIFWPEQSQPAAAEREIKEDDLEAALIEDGYLDLKPVVREQIYLNVPRYTHCKEDCRGLCPLCGINLNQRQCTCSPGKGTDSPFSVLRKLKKTS